MDTIVLGVDNVIFISILSSKLPASQQGRAPRLGLLARDGDAHTAFTFDCLDHQADGTAFYIFGRPISGRDLVLIGGGLFFLAKATIEIHERLESEEGHSSARVRPSFGAGHRLFARFSH